MTIDDVIHTIQHHAEAITTMAHALDDRRQLDLVPLQRRTGELYEYLRCALRRLREHGAHEDEDRSCD